MLSRRSILSIVALSPAAMIGAAIAASARHTKRIGWHESSYRCIKPATDLLDESPIFLMSITTGEGDCELIQQPRGSSIIPTIAGGTLQLPWHHPNAEPHKVIEHLLYLAEHK